MKYKLWIILLVYCCTGCKDQVCISSENIENLGSSTHITAYCKFQRIPTDLSDLEKTLVYNYENTKEVMTLNSFKKSFAEIYTENEELWNPTDDQQQTDPYRLILGVIRTKNRIGIQYAVGGLRCCDTIFHIYIMKHNRITNDQRILLN